MESERVESPYQITIAVSLSVKQDSMKIVVSCQTSKKGFLFFFFSLFLLMVHVVYYWILSAMVGRKFPLFGKKKEQPFGHSLCVALRRQTPLH